MAQKKIYELTSHSSIVSTDVFPISDDNSGNGEKQSISGLTTYLASNITGIPATAISDGSISNTEFGYLNGVSSNIQTQIDSKANTTHTHTTSDITNLSSYTGFDARYYTETETDTLLSAKQATLVSGTNIKTVNGTTLLGSGDLVVGGAVDSVNTYTGVVVLNTDDISDSGRTNKRATAGEKTKLGYISVTQAVDLDTIETNSNASKVKTDFITVTQNVDLDTIESDTATNNAKVTNATHTGEVTGSGALTVDKTAITNKSTVTPVSGDFVLISDTSDSGNLKKVDAADFIGGGSGSGTVDSIQPGNNIDVDNTDPANPIVSVENLVLADITDVTASVTEINYVSGVTSSIQTQLNAKESALTFSTGLTRATNTITNNLSTGIAGGQTAYGGTAASDNLILQSTTNATRGNVKIDTTSGGFNFRDYLTSIPAMYNGGNVTVGSDSFILASFGTTSMFYGAGGASNLYHYVSGGNRTQLSSSAYSIGVNTVISNAVGLTPSSRLEVRTDAIAVTQTNTSGLALANTTAATSGVTAQYSPALRFTSNAWKSNATAISQTNDWRMYAAPITGASSITPIFTIEQSVAGGSYIPTMLMGKNGVVGAIFTNNTDNTGYFIGNTSFNPSNSTSTSIGWVKLSDSGNTLEVKAANSYSAFIGNAFNGLYFNASSNLAGFNTSRTDMTSVLEVRKNSLGVTQTTSSGLALTNTTVSTVSLNQISPALRFSGTGWKTNATAGSQNVDIRNYLTTTTGAVSPSGSIVRDASINGGAYTQIGLLTTTGQMFLGSTSTGIGIGAANLTTGVADVTGGAVRYYGLAGATGGSYVHFFSNGSTRVPTSSTNGFMQLVENFSPTSGTAVYSILELKPTINQTGGANGITRGIYINPTVTAAADFRALEVATGNSIFGGKIIAGDTVRLKGYTVATLPAGTQGDTALVTDATTPTYLGVAVGGGAVVAPVFYDGTNWISAAPSLLSKQFRIDIPGEQVLNTTNFQGYWYNDTGASITISNVGIFVGTAASGSGAALTCNIYKSSGTAADGLNTNAVALFSSDISLGTGYTSATNAPNTATVEAGRWVTIRIITSAGATTKASDLTCVVKY